LGLLLQRWALGGKRFNIIVASSAPAARSTWLAALGSLRLGACW